ncbi:MAG TPA: ATP-dependent DNA helicase RecG [bacterium]|nr:MAG: ATP-dependent DNA helicase RecG [Parcubacteria group bacterium ADurb.Bin115]HNU81774.1 ATP-dependent DNA helicase RecG [bacterium]HOD87263.1 ATP-dependent DNA helicase RecG [bacterium]HPW05854.1 ATP-dependent DNA helicase RecG [bacterium]HPY99534.1 ATP-dependent DNA helicase RecG [bacterium]
MLLSVPLPALNRVGKNTAQSLKKLGLETVQDLLLYFPFRYDDFSQTTSIDKIEAGQNISITGTIELIQNKRSVKQRRQLTEALISDDSGLIKVIWFNQPFIAQNLKPGDRVSLAGKTAESYGQLTLISPQYEKIGANGVLIHTQGLVPIYHLNADITQKQFRFLIKQAIEAADKFKEWLPESVRKELQLLPLATAIKRAHFPENMEQALAARKRLGFDELFIRQLRSQALKYQLKNKVAPKIIFQEMMTKKFVQSLPFTLTTGQKQAAWEILQDINKDAPMSRLLEGDAGSGKTVVAAMALFNVAINKYQGALMAPTEILAGQHYQSIQKLLGAFNVKIALLTGHQAEANFELPKNKAERREKIIKDAEIIIGTQALIQDYNISKLALVIVDEQHRFGVKQRQKLQQSGGGLWPHFLSMTATPIPRSLALSLYGDLDLSLIKELPKNRKPIITKVITEEQRDQAYNFVRQQIIAGRQAFIICPLVEESDKLGVRSATAEYKRLKKEVFPDLEIGLIHGKLKSAEKEKIMSALANKDIQILVATAVVEVGVDIPNASVILIEGAERFGLAQLHQFRGRVGRGEEQSYCLLLTSKEQQNPKTAERLQALSKYNDGLSLAKIDLKLRGAGDLYGLVQSGFPELRIASLFDYEMIKKTQISAEKIIKSDPELANYPALREKLGDTSNEEAHLE